MVLQLTLVIDGTKNNASWFTLSHRIQCSDCELRRVTQSGEVIVGGGSTSAVGGDITADTVGDVGVYISEVQSKGRGPGEPLVVVVDMANGQVGRRSQDT